MNKTAKKIRNIIFIALMVLINAFIIFEASLPGGLSSIHSGIFSDWFGGIINDHVSVEQDIVKVDSLKFKTDKTQNKFIIGTTTRLDVELLPLDASDKAITYKAEPSDKVNLVPQGTSVYVEIFGEVDDEVVISATSHNGLSDTYKCKIIDRIVPTDFKASIINKEIPLHTSEAINIELLDNDKNLQSRLIRKYDSDRLTYEVKDPSIAKVEHGFIKALAVGETEVIVGGVQNIPIKIIKNEITPIYPLDNITFNLEHEVHVKDIDYYESHPNMTGSKLIPDFKGIVPSDANFAYRSLTPILAYVDENGTIYGNKKEGIAKIEAVSIADPSIVKVIDVAVTPVLPTSMSISYSGDTNIRVGKSFTISASFEPFNTSNKMIQAFTDNDTVVGLSGAGQNINVTALDAGEANITISSVSNPSLKEVKAITFDKKLAINEDNQKEFNTFIRKALGHFSLFFVDGIFTTLMFVFVLEDKKFYNLARGLGISLATGFGVAWLSEFIQIFVKRGPAIADVMLDFTGFIIAAIIVVAIIGIVNNVKSKHNKEENKNE